MYDQLEGVAWEATFTRHGCTTPRYAYIFFDVECDRSDSARLYSVPVLHRSPPSMLSRLFFVNKPVSCTTLISVTVSVYDRTAVVLLFS